MGQAKFGAVLSHIRTIAVSDATKKLTDGQLLRQFLASRDEAAFTAIVQRHGPLVWTVCRNVLEHDQDAEDAMQATFLVLATRAGSVRRSNALASWLHGVAYRTALLARRRAAAQRSHETARTMMGRSKNESEGDWKELLAILDKEIRRLPEKYAAPFVLCCLEELSGPEAARQLGWKEGTVAGRLSQARKLLRQRLRRRGIDLTLVLGGLAVANRGAPAARIAQSAVDILHAAKLLSTGQAATGFVSARATGLWKGVVKSMFLSKVKVGLAVVFALAAVSAGLGQYARLGAPDTETGQSGPVGVAVRSPDPPKADEAKAGAAQTLRVTVLDPEGKPLPDAKVLAGIWTKEKDFKHTRYYKTDAAGIAQVKLPKTFYILRLWASKKPFVTMFAAWEQNELAVAKQFPAEYRFRLETGVAAGGRILDEQGKPIAGVKVQVRLEKDPKPADADGRVRYDVWLADGVYAARTNAEGLWHIDNVPRDQSVELSLLVSHPEYVSDENWGERQRAAGITTAMLRQKTAILTLKRGVIVRGRVTDPAGKPIKDAIVVRGKNSYFSTVPCKFSTDVDGRFRLPTMAPTETVLTVIVPGWAPQMRRIKAQIGLPLQSFRMEPGKPIRLRIVDSAGRPVPKAEVNIVGWKGIKSLQTLHNPNHPKIPDMKIPRRPDATGLWEWAWAPDDPVRLRIDVVGGAPCDVEIGGGAPVRTVVLKSEHRITGRVTDAVTGRPIPAFTVIPIDVFGKGWLCAERMNSVAGKNGRLEYVATRTDVPLRVRIEALGYRTQDGPEFRVGDDTSRTQEFRLHPSPPISGLIVDAVGRPVANAEVLLATPTEQAKFHSDGSNHETTTEVVGRFAFPDPGEAFVVVAKAGAGFARAEFSRDQHDVGTLRLRPWAAVRGQFRDGGQPVRGASIILEEFRIDSMGRPRIDTREWATTDANGFFEFSRVPPIPVHVFADVGPWRDDGYRSGPSVPLDLRPGERRELDLGGGGTVVTGKVNLTGKVPAGLDCAYSLNLLVRRELGITPPPEIAKLGLAAKNGWIDTFQAKGAPYLTTLRYWSVKLTPDGSFRISGVPAGEYDLAIKVFAKPSGRCLVDLLAQKMVRVTVTAEDVSKGTLALPELAAEVVSVPAVGVMPAGSER